PLTEANMPLARIVVAAVRPGRKATRLLESPIRRCERPPAVKKSPVAMNKGTARKAKLLSESIDDIPMFASGKSITQYEVAATHKAIRTTIGGNRTNSNITVSEMNMRDMNRPLSSKRQKATALGLQSIPCEEHHADALHDAHHREGPTHGHSQTGDRHGNRCAEHGLAHGQLS